MRPIKSIVITSAAVLSLAMAAPAHGEDSALDEAAAEIAAEISHVGSEEVRQFIVEAAEKRGVSAEEVARQVLDEHRRSVESAQSAGASSNSDGGHEVAGGGDEVNLVEANSKGDIFVSPASTMFVEHGHTGVYFEKGKIIEAPGTGKKSHKTNAVDRKVGRGAQLMNVEIGQQKKDAAADYADKHLLGKGYNVNFAVNKDPRGSEMNCSQLVWAAFKLGADVDLDGNGGLGVYPYDIRDSDLTSMYRTL